MPDPFADAQAWYDRAQQHIREYRAVLDGDRRRIWSVDSRRRDDGSFVYSLTFDRGLLFLLKPIACETANALFQSLDNIIAAAARSAGVERTPQIAWPWAMESDPDSAPPGRLRPAIDGRLAQLRKRGMPEPWISLIEETFAMPAAGLEHIDVLKEVSLSGKHWELVPTSADALAIAWLPDGAGQQVVVEIPNGHFSTEDEYVFHEGEKLQLHLQLVTGICLAADGYDFQPEPVAAFEYASRFALAALEGARRRWPCP
jgi:hypothetical protein